MGKVRVFYSLVIPAVLTKSFSKYYVYALTDK